MTDSVHSAGLAAPAPTIGRVPVGVPLLLLALAVLAMNPIGYVGGGGDDWHYLVAAECWASNGACLPHDHWSARWPLVAPLAASIALLGESRASIAVVPVVFALLSLLLFAHLAERLFGRRAALLGGCALVLTPAFATLVARPNVDLVELCFLLAAAAAWLKAGAERRKLYAVLAGAALALAFQTRETSAALIAVVGPAFFVLSPDQKRLAPWAVPGFAAPLLGEMAAYWAATGDPFGRFRLALSHTQIPSTELAASVDRSRSPLFNPDFIGGWQPANGIDLHWTVNGILNLATHPAIGLTLTLGALLFVGLGRRVDDSVRRPLGTLLAAAAIGGLILIYALAVDPKPRMFLPLLCAAAAAIGALLPVAWRSWPRALVIGGCVYFLLRSLLVIAASPSVAPAEAVAAQWIESHGEAITIDETTRRHLALVPAARALPVDDPGRPLRLRIAWGACAGAGVEAEHRLAESEPALARLARAAELGIGRGDSYALCLARP